MKKAIKDADPYTSHPPWCSDGLLLPWHPTFTGGHQPCVGGTQSAPPPGHNLPIPLGANEKRHRPSPLSFLLAQRMGEREGMWPCQGHHSQSPALLAPNPAHTCTFSSSFSKSHHATIQWMVLFSKFSIKSGEADKRYSVQWDLEGKSAHESVWTHWLCYINIKPLKNSFSFTLVNVRRIICRGKKVFSKSKLLHGSQVHENAPCFGGSARRLDTLRKVSQPEACWAELKGRSCPSARLAGVFPVLLSLMQKSSSHRQWYQS